MYININHELLVPVSEYWESRRKSAKSRSTKQVGVGVEGATPAAQSDHKTRWIRNFGSRFNKPDRKSSSGSQERVRK